MRKGITLIEIMIGAAILLALVALIGGAVFSSGSMINSWNDMGRDRRDTQKYKLTIWDGGKVVKEEIITTFIDVKDNGSGLRFYKDNKLVMMAGTYYLEEL